MPEITSGSNDDRRGTFRRRNGQVVEVPPRRAPRATRVRRDGQLALDLSSPEPDVPEHLARRQFAPGEQASAGYMTAYRSYWSGAFAHQREHGTLPPAQAFIDHMGSHGYDISTDDAQP